jgi:hypothetical protein
MVMVMAVMNDPRYEIWCSTEHGNKRLDAAWREREGKVGRRSALHH